MFEALLMALSLGVMDWENGAEAAAAAAEAPVTSERCVAWEENENWNVCMEGDELTLVHLAPMSMRTDVEVVLIAKAGKITWMDLGRSWVYDEKPEAELWKLELEWASSDDAFDDAIELSFREGQASGISIR